MWYDAFFCQGQGENGMTTRREFLSAAAGLAVPPVVNKAVESDEQIQAVAMPSVLSKTMVFRVNHVDSDEPDDAEQIEWEDQRVGDVVWHCRVREREDADGTRREVFEWTKAVVEGWFTGRRILKIDELIRATTPTLQVGTDGRIKMPLAWNIEESVFSAAEVETTIEVVAENDGTYTVEGKK